MVEQKETPLDKLFRAYETSVSARSDMYHLISAQYGINRKDAYPLDSQKQANIVQYLSSAGFTTTNDKGVDQLTITSVKNITPDGHIVYSNIITTVFEKHIIHEFCNSSEQAVLKKYENTPFIQMRRRNYVPVEAYMADANMTVTYHQESAILYPEHDVQVGAVRTNWEHTKKKFKLSNRVIYTHPNHPFTVELHTIRESKYALSANQKMVPDPTFSMAEAGLYESYEKYEVYVNFNPSIVLSLPLVKKGLHICTRLILGGIQMSSYPILFSERDAVLKQYMNLFRPGEKMEERRYGGLDTQKISFIGPYPDTIGPEHVQPLVTSIDIPNIRTRFTVTDKTDGLRSLLFIADSRKIYMITTSMDVIYTGAKIKDEAFVNTLMDGEFVSHDKHGHPLSLFAVFDIYFDRGQNVRERPFIQPKYVIPEIDIVKDIYPTAPRFHLLEHIINTRMSLIYENGKCKTPFQIKSKSFYHTENNPDISIFQVCKTVLQSQGFDYEIDGLIFTHMDMPVAGNTPSEKNIPFKHKTRWKWALKWKPPNKNSIDFLVQIKKTENHLPLIVSEVDPHTNQFVRYYVAQLYCGGYDQKEAVDSYLFPTKDDLENIPPCNMLKPVLFRPTSPSSETACIARIPMTFVNNEWVIQTESGELLEDNSIVEFYYDMERPPQYRWRPMLMRHDKTHDYRVIRKRAYGNTHDAADRIWSSIHNPITTDMITSGEHLPIQGQDLAKIYYNRDGSKIYTEGLREFHNYYIKQKLLGAVLTDSDTLIDYSCGRGGDINKWVQMNPTFILGIDLSHDNIYNSRAGVYARLVNLRRKQMHPPPGLFIQGNSVMPIRSGDIAIQESDRAKLMHIFGTGAPLPEEEAGPLLAPAYGIARNGFNVGSCQFSIHYFFKDPDTVHAFMKNVAQTVMIGGYFVGTCFDGDTVFHKLRNHMSDTPLQLKIEGHVIFRAARKYLMEEFGTGAQSVGYPITIYQDSINQEIVEYLVKYDYLKELMRTYGFEPVNEQELKDKGMVGKGMFMDMFRDLYASRHDPATFDEYKKAIQMTEPEREISSWNRWFMFKHVKATTESEWSRQRELDSLLYQQHARVMEPEPDEIINKNENEDIVLDSVSGNNLPLWTNPETDQQVVLDSVVGNERLSDAELFHIAEEPDIVYSVIEREYNAGEKVTLYNAKSKMPLSRLSSYAMVNDFHIPNTSPVFHNPENYVFPSAEHAFQSQYFTDATVRNRFSVNGDLGQADSGFSLLRKSDKVKADWLKHDCIGVIAFLAMQTPSSRKKLNLVPDTTPADVDNTWMYILLNKFKGRPIFREVLEGTGDTYILEKTTTGTNRGGEIEGDIINGENKMGQYLMTVRHYINILPSETDKMPSSSDVPLSSKANTKTQYVYATTPIPPSEQLPTEQNDILPVSSSFLENTFPNVKGVKRTQLLMTKQGEYSVSKTAASAYLVELIRLRCMKGKNSLTVTDATGSVGSDSISLGLHYHVNSIEMSPVQIRILAHNIHMYGSAVNIDLYKGDSLQLIPLLEQDVIYMDAPWGGRDYKDNTKMQLFMSGVEIAEVYNQYHKYCSWMIFKVPVNYDTDTFKQTCHAPHQEIIPFYKKDKISFFFIVCSEITDGPKDLPNGRIDTVNDRPVFYHVDAAYEYLKSYLPVKNTTIQPDPPPLFEISPRALRNTLEYTMNVLFQTGFILAVSEDPAVLPIMYNIRTRTTDLDKRVYIPFIKAHVENLRHNRGISNSQYERIQKTLTQPYRLLGGIVTALKEDDQNELQSPNEYEQFIRKFELSLPPGLYYFNLSDTVIVHEDGKYPFPNVVPASMRNVNSKPYFQKPLLPVFSASKRDNYADIVIPNYDDIIDALNSVLAVDVDAVTKWEDKTISKAVFRGTGTGEGCSPATNMRLRLAEWGSKEEWKQILDACLTSRNGKIKIDSSGLCKTNINPEWTGDRLTMKDQSKYKYIIHIDGNVAAYRLLKTMQLGSLVLRVKGEYTQWADKYLRAGIHYIEVAEDLSDLKTVLEHCRANDAMCAQIATDGKILADRLRSSEALTNGITEALKTY